MTTTNHDAPHQPDTHDGPKSCYPEDVATLREMLAEVRESLADAEQGIADRRAIADYTWKKAQSERRIEALQTAIEALGGAL